MRKKRCLIQVFILWTLSGIAIQADNRPNLIFLMTDDQRADSLGCMGNRVIQTPNIDVMASDGLVFENAFVTTAICMTSRACVLTGQYAARHGIQRPVGIA